VTAARPVALPRSTVALAAVSLGVFGVARTTGSGWLVVLLAAIGAAMVLGFVLPAPGAVRARIGIDAPSDAVVGRAMQLTLDVWGTARPLLVRVRESDGEWTSVAPPVRGRLEATPARRGLVTALTVDVRCAAPLGLVWWGRSVVVPLARPIEVGPRPADVEAPPPSAADGAARDARLAFGHGDDLVRGVRDYQSGDPIRTVHWPATARHGQLMVRELEAATAPPLTIAVRLGPPGGVADESVASRAAGVALAGLRAGRPVMLLTREASGPVRARVGTPLDVSRRLARAVVGEPAGRAARPS
jgi:uncharacterized protein (DUF58 family)